VPIGVVLAQREMFWGGGLGRASSDARTDSYTSNR